MAIINTAEPLTLADYESLCGDKDLSRKVLINTIRDYMSFFDQGVILPGNDGTGDKGQLITKYPEGQLRAFNEGWTSEVAAGNVARYSSSMMRTRSTVDLALYNTRKPSDRATYRMRQDVAFMRGLARKAVKRVFYGNQQTDLRDMMGIANIVVPTNEAFKDRIIDAKGTTAGKLTDIWLFNWDPASFYMFYPQGGEGPGLQVEDMGEQYVSDKNGKQYRALVTEYGWDLGLAIYDPERVVRIANVDTDKLSKKNTSGPDLIDLLMQAKGRLTDETSGKVAFYMADDVRSFFERQVMNKDNVLLSMGDVQGRQGVPTLSGIPIHKIGTDVILTNQNQMTGIN